MMNTSDYDQVLEDYSRIEQALEYLAQHHAEQPSLQDVASSVNLSEFHFQRLFSRWVGISPKRFLQYLTKEHAKELLRSSRDVLETTYAAGLSSPGRLHDLFVQCEAVTPGEYKRKGEGLEISYGFHPGPFGEFLLASTERGVCNLTFVQTTRREALESLRKSWERARLIEDPASTRRLAQAVFQSELRSAEFPLALWVRGTNFQINVWEALLRIPSGMVVSYEDIAIAIGMPTAVRAVGHAVGQNPVPYLIPCHRVIHKVGTFGNYGGGKTRKMAILGWEMAHAEPAAV